MKEILRRLIEAIAMKIIMARKIAKNFGFVRTVVLSHHVYQTMLLLN